MKSTAKPLMKSRFAESYFFDEEVLQKELSTFLPRIKSTNYSFFDTDLIQDQDKHIKNVEECILQKTVQGKLKFQGLKQKIRSANQISNSKKPRPIRNILKLRIDPQLQNEMKALQKIYYDRKKQRLIQLEQQIEIPFYDDKFDFMEFMYEQTLAIQLSDKTLGKCKQIVEDIELILKQKAKRTDSELIKKEMNNYSLKIQGSLNQLNYKQELTRQKAQNLQEESNLKLYQLLLTITEFEENSAKLSSVQNQNRRKKQELIMLQDSNRQKDEKIKMDKFDTSIIKLQFGDTFYRYGVNIYTNKEDRHAFFNSNYGKWDLKAQKIEAQDLRVFVLAMLYPMARSIFNDFSYQSNIYKVMFGMQKNLSNKQIVQSFMMLRERIEKHYIEKKVGSIQLCIKNNIVNKKKKIIFIGNRTKFDAVIKDLIYGSDKINEGKALASFTNEMLQITDVKFNIKDDKIQDTHFIRGQLLCSGKYDNISFTTCIDVIFCAFQHAIKESITLLRKKVHKFEPVLCWLQIPKIMINEKLQEMKQINSILSKCEHFGLEIDRKKFKSEF